MRQDEGVRTASTSPPRIDGSMALLVDMMTGSSEPSYEAAARRRAAAHGSAPRRALVTGVVALVLVALGVAVGTSAAQVRMGSASTSEARQRLVDEVRRQTAASDRLARDATVLREQVATERDAALGEGARGRGAAAELATLELLSGAVAVHGPGVTVTLDDAPAARPDAVGGATTTAPRGGQPTTDGRVLDRDLQDVANALWAAGAEAMSINGLRLTAQTAIRSAGEAILVDFRPLSPPYVVRAVGDAARLEPDFADSPTGRRFTTYTSLYGLGFEVTRARDLQLPAAGAPDLRLARPGPP